MSDDKTLPTPAPGAAPANVSTDREAPFARKAITWGRMPQTTFHVGPVPVAPDPLARIKVPPRAQGQGQIQGQGQARPSPRPTASGASILSGSLIPQARPQPATPPVAEPKLSDPAPAASRQPDLAVRPLPGAEPERPAPKIEAAPAPVVAAPSAAPGPVLARAGTRKTSRLPLYVGAGIVAVLVIAGGLWFALRPDAAPVAPATVPAVAPSDATPVLQDSAPLAEDAPPAVAPAPAVTSAPGETVSRPVEQTAPRRAASPTAPTNSAPPQRSSAPVEAAPAPVEAPPPAIETAPLVVVTPPAPAPTAARPAQTDPDAPVVTRPQPLD